jgi:N,N'-diacetylchitobiose transport system permease protein
MTSSPAADVESRAPERQSAAPGRGRRRARGRPPNRQSWRAWLLLAPGLATLAVLLLYPLYRVAQLSFLDFGLRELNLGGAEWIGVENYQELLKDDRLWTIVLPNTVVFAVANVLLTIVFGTLVALLLFRLGPWMRGIVTTAIMAAWAVPAVTGTYAWVFIFDARRGPAMRLLDWLGLADPDTTNWFDDRLTFFAIATINVVHHGFPFVAVTVLAGLMTVPKEMVEAATIDGASSWRRFWNVTFPTLRPVFAVVTILSTIWDFKVFTQIYLMPGGDGLNREVLNLGTWSYITSFGQQEYGRGAALAVMLTLVLLVITFVYLRVLFREEEL